MPPQTGVIDTPPARERPKNVAEATAVPAAPAAERAVGALKGLRVLFLGHGDLDYSRNRIVLKALRRAGAEVLPAFDRRALPGRSAVFLQKTIAFEPDVVWVGFPGQADVPVAKLAARCAGAPLIFDAFLSTYERYVADGKRRPSRLEALRRRWLDGLSARLADLVLLDTEAHIGYFHRAFGVPVSKCRRLWVGADDELVKPLPARRGAPFTVFCYSSFLPLHGMDVVVRAARLLRERGEAVRFLLPGGGQTYQATAALARGLDAGDIRFTGKWVPFRELLDQLEQAQLCLGIFGTREKTKRVIPNKVFDALASRRAVVTADTPAAREALAHRKTAWLCPTGSPEALADAILALKNDAALRESIADNGHRLFLENFCLEALTRDVSSIVLEAVRRRL